MPDDNVTAIRANLTPPGSVDQEIVDYLEWITAEARAGRVRAVAVAAINQHDVFHRWFRINPPLANSLVGAVERLKTFIIAALDETDEPRAGY